MNHALRLRNLRQIMAEQRLQAVLLTDRFSKYYFARLYSASGYVLVTQDSQTLLVDGRYIAECREQSPEFEIRLLDESHGLAQHLADIHQQHEWSALALDGNHLSHQAWARLAAQCTFPLQHWDTHALRQVKQPEEIALIRKAASIACQALSEVQPLIRPGITEKALADEIEMAVRRAGGSKTSFDTVVVSGLRSALPHGRPTDKRLAEGELVTVDFGAVFQHYCSDMTRTFALGNVSTELEKLYCTVLRAQKAAREAVRPGIHCQALDELARNIISDAGYGEYFSHNLGHGIGLDVHEVPTLRPGNTDVLQAGMIITIEPGIYIPGLGGARIEDDVLVTEEGFELLTDSPREWESCCLR